VSAQAERGRLRGVHVLWMMLGFFGLVIGVNAVFITLAVGSFPGEDVRRSYLQGLHYNETIAERRAQAALGWQVSAEAFETGEGRDIAVQFAARDGAPLDGLEVTGVLMRPTDAREDAGLRFTPCGPGRYCAKLGGSAPGQWRLRARAQGPQGALDFERSFFWRSATP